MCVLDGLDLVVLLLLDEVSIKTALLFHVKSELVHFLFVLVLNLVEDSLVLLTNLSLLFDVIKLKRIHELVM